MQSGKHCTCCNPKSTGDKVRIDLQKWGMRSACGVCPGTQPEGSCEDCEWGGRCDSCVVDPANSYPGALLHPRTPAPGGMVPARVLACDAKDDSEDVTQRDCVRPLDLGVLAELFVNAGVNAVQAPAEVKKQLLAGEEDGHDFALPPADVDDVQTSRARLPFQARALKDR